MTEANEFKPVYQIKVKGKLPEHWSDWFNGMALTCETVRDGVSITTLTGPVIDQAALHGILDRILDLNLGLISVDRIRESHPPSGGE